MAECQLLTPARTQSLPVDQVKFARVRIKLVAGRRAVVTRELNGHAPCHYCGACGRGCDIGAFFNASDAKRGRLERGYFADVVVFDPKTINSPATYENPTLAPTGIRHAFRNGTEII